MSLFLAIPIMALNALAVLARPRLGVAIYVGLSLLVPHPSVGGLAVAYEILALPLILVAVAVRRPRLRHLRFHLFLATFLGLMVLSTILGTTRYGTGVDLIRFQGLVRFLVLLGLTRELLDRETIERVLVVVLTSNAAIGLAQLLLPGMGQLTFRLYGRASQAVLQRYALEGLIPRASGTFSSPVILGSVALLALSIAWTRILTGSRQRRHRWLMITAALTGILSLTKTFLIGAPVVLLGGFLISPFVAGMRPMRFRPRTFALTLGAAVAAVGLAVWTGGFLNRLGFNVAYYVAYLAHPTEALTSRYGPGGTLGAAVRIILANPVFGVGMTSVEGEFLGDSTYTLLLHSTGLIGAIVAALGLALVVQQLRRRRRSADFVVLGALLLAGVGLPIVFSFVGALALAYLLVPSVAADGSGEAMPARVRRESGVPAHA